MNEEKIKYIHEEIVHNFKAARKVVPIIIEIFKPKSVVDVGCGIGTWLKVFMDLGISDVLGIDGDYVDKNKLKINKKYFVEHNLEEQYRHEKKFDIAISLEVAEHLAIQSADIFVKTLVNLSDTVIFSAAIPNQGGQNHINEREPQYWIEKFKEEGYDCFDVIRPLIWDNHNVDSWYRQNMLIFTRKPYLKESLAKLKGFDGKYLVHPLIFDIYIKELQLSKKKLQFYKKEYNCIYDGKKSVKFYLNLIFKAFKIRFI